MNDLWEGLRHDRDIAASVVANQAKMRPAFVGTSRSVVDSLGRAYAEARGASIWGEKTPGHLVWLPQIREMFPEARIIITVRDPRDIALSYDDRWGAGRRDTSYLMRSCAQIRYYFDHLSHMPPFPAEQVCRVRYEELVAGPEAEIKKVCGFLNVPFDPAMLDFYRSHQTVEQDTPDGKHHKLLSRPVTAERVGRFQLAFSPPQIQLMEEFFGDHLTAYRYQSAGLHGHALTDRDKRWLQYGTRQYRNMSTGRVRRKLRAKAKIRAFAFKWRAILMRERFSRLAVASPAWAARVANH